MNWNNELEQINVRDATRFITTGNPKIVFYFEDHNRNSSMSVNLGLPIKGQGEIVDGKRAWAPGNGLLEQTVELVMWTPVVGRRCCRRPTVPLWVLTGWHTLSHTSLHAMASPLTSVRVSALASVALLLLSAVAVDSSQGDKEPVYRECVKQCVRTNCTGARLRGFQSAQPQYMALTGEKLLLFAGWLT